MKRKFMPLVMLSVLFLFAACKLDQSQFDNIKLEGESPAFVVPLLHSTLSFKQLAERDHTGTLVEDPATGLWHMQFSQDFDLGGTKMAKMLLERMNEKNLRFVFDNSSRAWYDANEDVWYWYSNPTTSIDANEWKLLRLYPEQAKMTVSFTYSGTKLSGIVDFEPSFIPDGNAKSSVLVDFSGTQSHTAFQLVKIGNKIKDYPGHFEFKEDENTGHRLLVKIKGLKKGDTPITDQADFASTSLNMTVDITNITAEAMHGSFSVPAFLDTISRNMEVGVFRNTVNEADIHFEDARIFFELENQHLPIKINPVKIKVARSGEFGNEEDSIRNTPNYEETYTYPHNNLPYKTLKFGQKNDLTAPASYVLNSENSNIAQAFNLAPTEIEYKIALSCDDPLNINSPAFTVSRDSGVGSTLHTRLDLPLYGYANVLTKMIKKNKAEDTLKLPDIDLSNYYMDSAKVILHLQVANSMPVEMDLQIDFYNENGVWIDSLPTSNIIPGADVDDQGKSMGKYIPDPIEIEYDYDRYKKLQEARTWDLRVGFHTSKYSDKGTPGKSVKIESGNELEVMLGVILQPRIGRTKKQQQK